MSADLVEFSFKVSDSNFPLLEEKQQQTTNYKLSHLRHSFQQGSNSQRPGIRILIIYYDYDYFILYYSNYELFYLEQTVEPFSTLLAGVQLIPGHQHLLLHLLELSLKV